MTLGKSPNLNNNLFSLFNAFVALLQLFLDGTSVYFGPGAFKFRTPGTRAGEVGLGAAQKSRISFQVDCESPAKASEFPDAPGVNHWCLGGNLRG